MPRTQRVHSKSNIYHVMIRGNNKKDIFIDDWDRAFFMKLLKEYAERSEFRLYAYCLMSNHIHLLIDTGGKPIGQVIKPIASRYASWFNQKYEKIGHLFQDRFKSEPVENRRYFLTVLRYIIQNPLKAGLENSLGHYRWNCYTAYTDNDDSVIDTQYAVKVAGNRQFLLDFIQVRNDDVVMEITDADERKLSDSVARSVMTEITHCLTPSTFLRKTKTLQKEYIKILLDKGLSIRQISELTGWSKSAVFRAK